MDVLASRLTHEHAKEIASLEIGELRKLRGVYEEARLELLGRLTQLGQSSRSDTFTAQHLRGALAQVQAGAATITKKLEGAHETAILSAADDGARQTIDEIGFFERTRDFRGASLGAIQTQALRSVAAQNGLLAHQFATSLNTYGAELLGDVQRRLGVHIAMRSTWGAMSADIAGHLEASAVVGARWKAERIVRTELHNALGAGNHAGLESASQKLPDLLRQWDSTNDLRRCPRCRQLHGQQVAVDKPFLLGGLPIMRPPLHPNDRCRVTPFRKAWLELDQAEPPEIQIEVTPQRARATIRRVVPDASAADVAAAKAAYRKALLDSPTDEGALEKASGALRTTLLGFHKRKLSGQMLADTVAGDLEATITSAQAALAKARTAAAKELAFSRKSLAEAVEKAAGQVPEAHLEMLRAKARRLAQLEGKVGDDLEAAIQAAVQDAKSVAVEKYAAKVAAAGTEVLQ